jgi:hypothetical protein
MPDIGILPNFFKLAKYCSKLLLINLQSRTETGIRVEFGGCLSSSVKTKSMRSSNISLNTLRPNELGLLPEFR